jgi:hypothetical protein
MAGTQAQLDALDAVIAAAALSITQPDGRSVDYPPMDELLKRRAWLVDSMRSPSRREPASIVLGFRRDS